MTRFFGIAAVTLATVFNPANPAAAAPPATDVVSPIYYPVTNPLPAGLACSYPLSIVSTGDRVQRTYTDVNGQPIRVLQAGRGWELTFTNVVNGSTLTIKPNGSVYQQRNHPDGSQTVTATGHNVIIFFPTDVPAGPSTIQYVGKITYTVSANGVSTIQQVSGKQIDICAALAN